MKDITLGQYFPGNSVIHRLDPRAKLLCVVLYITMIFVASSVSGVIFSVFLTLFLIILSGIPLKIFLRGMKPVLFIVLFTTFLNLFLTSGETLLVDFGFIHIYLEGLCSSILIVVRITLLVAGSGLFMTYTTTPIALSDGLESLLAPLKKIKVPVHEFSMMLTIALRFIPTIMEETEKIMNAQKARGADFTTGSLVNRAKALIPVLIPLFVSAFRRADELAVAMECRCYRGDEGRTRMKILKYTKSDIAFLAAGVIFVIGMILLNRFLPIYRLR